MKRNEQVTSELTPKQQAEQEKDILLAELNLLTAFKRVWDTEDGRSALKWVLWASRPLANPMTGNSHTYFMLGEQNTGKKLLKMLIDSGCSMDVSLLDEEFDINRIENISRELNIIQNEEVTKR